MNLYDPSLAHYKSPYDPIDTHYKNLNAHLIPIAKCAFCERVFARVVW